jgi:amino-acid N-acetyltransferase
MSEPFMIRGRPPRSAALALLHSEGLPVSDITDEHLEHFFFSATDGSPTGLVGLEIYDSVALLRSLVVGENARGKGLGSALTQHAEQYAASKNVGSMYLLTTTAELFFNRLGYQRIDRTQAPPFIERTREFADLCPANSAFMVKSL